LGGAQGGKIVEVTAEQYVASVLAGEAGTFRNAEALKAMAVAARTYAAHFRSRHAPEGFDFCSTTHCQRAILQNVPGRFQEAADETRGELLWFHSEPALAAYTQDCGGTSEAAAAIWAGEYAPYLTIHQDPYCRANQHAVWHWEVSSATLANALTAQQLLTPPDLQRVLVLGRTSSGRVHTLSLIGARHSQPIAGSSFRFAIGRGLGWNTLRSELYTVTAVNGILHFEGRGAGHGAGLCQDGADEMAAHGKTYREILSFYYPGTSVSHLAQDVHWVGIRAGQMEIFATQHDIAHQAMRLTNVAAAELESQYHLPKPAILTVYVYPNLNAFRNGTGEPGWVAAHTFGSRVDTQPLRILQQQHGGFQSVMRHELLHVMIEEASRPGLPFWFREGLVESLARNGVNTGPEANPGARDEEIAERNDALVTRAAYRSAERRVTALRARYGTAELLRWLKDGLPAEAMRSSTSSNPADSK
jgi:stage II sporulation protein D